MGQLIFRFLIGAIAGLLIWMAAEPFKPAYVPNPETVRRETINDMQIPGAQLPAGFSPDTPIDPNAYVRYGRYKSAWERWERSFVYMLCAAIGAAVGGYDGFRRGGRRHTLRGIGLGLLFGIIGGPLGYGLGGVITAKVFGGQVFETGNPVIALPARIIAFTPWGLFLGAAIGASALNLKKTIQGAIGGLLGGIIAGAMFDPLSIVLAPMFLGLQDQSRGEVGAPGRAAMSLLLGALIALFIGLVERIARSAWLRLELGRNEGKEWSIDTAQTFIGRSEGAQVPLFGDPNIAPLHCSIQRQGPNYVLVDGGSPLGTLVNGHRVQSALLASGSVIQVGGFSLTFLLKNQPAPYRGPESYPGQAYPYGGAPMPGQPLPGQPMPPNAGFGQPTQAMPVPGMPMPGMPTQGMPIPGMPMQGMPAPGSPTQVMAPQGMPGTPTMAYGAGMVTGLTIVALDGPIMGQRFPVSGPIEIGREGAGIRLPHDANASRRHAVIAPGMGAVSVQDLGSTNGTFVNGQRVNQAVAGPGETIKIGSTTFRVEPG